MTSFLIWYPVRKSSQRWPSPLAISIDIFAVDQTPWSTPRSLYRIFRSSGRANERDDSFGPSLGLPLGEGLVHIHVAGICLATRTGNLLFVSLGYIRSATEILQGLRFNISTCQQIGAMAREALLAECWVPVLQDPSPTCTRTIPRHLHSREYHNNQ